MPSSAGRPDRPPVLVSVGGLPGTGKTTIARGVATALRAAYLRIDTIETAIAHAEGRHQEANGWEGPPGYVAGYALAADQLRLGLDVVAESVNPLRASRDAWRDAAHGAGGRVLEVEVVCSDPAIHRRRLERRTLDLAGLANPTWQEATERPYDPWDRPRLIVDTATLDVDASVHLVLDSLPAG